MRNYILHDDLYLKFSWRHSVYASTENMMCLYWANTGRQHYNKISCLLVGASVGGINISVHTVQYAANNVIHIPLLIANKARLQTVMLKQYQNKPLLGSLGQTLWS